MFDAKRLLGQFIANQVGQRLDGGDRYGKPDRGSYRPHKDDPLGSLGGGGGGALAGGLASLVLGSKKGRKYGGSAAKLGGMALVGSLAYRAFQNWQASQVSPTADRGSFLGGASAGGWGGAGPARSGAVGFAPTSHELSPPPAGSPFAPASEDAQQALSRTLLRAMIAAAKADGQIDGTEQAAIFGAMDELDIDAADKAFVIDEMRAPLDVDAIARSARNPEEAAEIYAASLLAIDVDNAAERGYLAMLAARLRLDEGLVAHLHATVEGETPAV